MIIWVIKIFFVQFSMYSCHLFLISSASVRSIPFLSFIGPIFAWNVPMVSLILLKRSLVFPILLFPSISLHWSLRKAFLTLSCYCLELCIHMGISFLFFLCLSLLLFSQLFVRPPQTTIVLFCTSFSWEWFWSWPPIRCHEPPSIVLQALWLLYLIPWICHFYCIIIRNLIWVIPEWSSGFPYFLQFKSERHCVY